MMTPGAPCRRLSVFRILVVMMLGVLAFHSICQWGTKFPLRVAEVWIRGHGRQYVRYLCAKENSSLVHPLQRLDGRVGKTSMLEIGLHWWYCGGNCLMNMNAENGWTEAYLLRRASDGRGSAPSVERRATMIFSALCTFQGG
ncbi:hypothetical protein EDD17DRAFT_1647916 [Pisolithus thermaeus]|nr:hypothetical protein EDD17DRAFT_1647916 [Pisolithus thermaeus]